MRKPQRPPKISRESFGRYVDEGLTDLRIDQVYREISRDNAKTGSRYLHWDQLVRREPPQGCSHENWWVAIKLGRSLNRKLLPLRSIDGNSCSFVQTARIDEAIHRIDKMAAGSIALPEPVINRDTRDRYVINSLIEEAITSSQLEGAATTRHVAAEMIRQGRKPKDRSERMILNNYRAMQKINEWKERPLTPDLILDIHRLMTLDTMNDPGESGRFCRPGERRDVLDHDRDEIVHIPPPPEEIPERIEVFCDFANKKIPEYFIHPVIRSIILHFWLAYEHPFLDGNGRTARALFYWSMLRNGYWLFEFLSISTIIKSAPSKYARAYLYTETDDNDLTYFILYHLDVIERSIEGLHEYIARKSTEIREVEKILRDGIELNHRQRALIGHALRHPGFRYTIESHQTSHNVAYATARADLLRLVELGILTKRRIGKRDYFTPVPELERALRGPAI